MEKKQKGISQQNSHRNKLNLKLKFNKRKTFESCMKL